MVRLVGVAEGNLSEVVNINTKNRFEVLGEENESEDFDKWTKRVKRNVTLEEKLKTKISNLKAELVLLNRNLLVNGRMNAQRMVKDSEEATDEKVNGLYDEFFYQTYKAEILKVKDLRWEKSKPEIDLFLSSRKPLTDVMMDMWTYDMMDYYLESDSSNVDTFAYSDSGLVQIRYVSVCIGHGPVQYALIIMEYLVKPIRRIQDFDESKDHCLTLKNTPYPHQRYAVYNTLVNEEESTGFTSIRHIHQEDTAYPCLYSPKDHKGIKLNTPYPEVQYTVLEIWNEYNILEDIKRGPYSKKSPIPRIPDCSIRRIDEFPDSINRRSKT
ncbi:hypothetical protein Tco_0409985 [Tanacetum coccineum]